MRILRTSLFVSLGLCSLFGVPGTASVAYATAQEANEGGSFAIPTARAALALAESTEEHIRAGRWPEALRALQSMVEESRSDLLGAEFPTTEDGIDSRRAVHVGAAQWATERILALPLNVREDYRRFYENDAEILLEKAKRDTDRRGLIEVASRYPATRSAELALWALGDLELELGNRTAAFHAWQRAACRSYGIQTKRIPDRSHWKRLLEAANLIAAQGEAETNDRGGPARIEFVLREFDFVEEHSGPGSDVALELSLDARSRQGRELRSLGTADEKPMAPGSNPGSWRTPFQLPEHPFSDSKTSRKGLYNLFPVRSGDRVLVSTSLEVFCLAAYTGELLWRGGLPEGWAEYFESRDGQSSRKREETDFFVGVDERYAMVAPAASDTIAVAALQIPITHIRNDKYQQIKITRVLPNRRLYAYDLETGEELWNHTPPEGWDGEEGSFSDRMRVAGPPVIAGSRVLVPTYRMQGRIDYQVGCFDLLTGDYLWSTALISGQRELNMFGRPEFEFCAAPLRVEGDVVIALTQLGSIAALDLLTGSTLWQVVYDQYELPKSKWGPNLRERTWLNASPLVVRDEVGRGVVIAAPVDGPYLVGLDFETGAALWTVPFEGGRRIQQGSNLLLGATEDTIFLGGPKVTALRAIGGLRSRPTRLWQTSYGVFDGAAFKGGGELPRGALGKDHVVFAASNARALVERDSGQVDERLASWKNGGNVLLTPGATFTLSNAWLNGYFEWDTLIRQANDELVRRPGEVDPAVRLARLRVDRADRHWQDGELEDARRQLEKAHDVLKTYADGARTGIRPEVASTMHDVLRARARIAIQGGELAQAQAMLRRARDLAPDVRELLATLLAEESLWRRSGDEPWLEIASELEQRCAGLSILCTIEIVDGASLRLIPLLDPVFSAPPTAELPVELWVRLERARRHELKSRFGAAFEDLHAVIEEFGSEEIGARSVRTLAAEGIARNLELGGGRGYEPFEKRAAEMLESARNSEDTEQVAAVSRFFPHSQASRAAHDVLLQVALEQGDATEVAAIVDSELPEVWAPEYADERQIDLVLGLANTLGRSGNADYERGLLKRFDKLGVRDPRVRQRFAQTTQRELPPPISERSGFNADSQLLKSYSGEYRSLGRVPGLTPAEEERHEVALFETLGSLVALSSLDPTQPLWTYDPVEPSRSARQRDLCAVAPGRVLYATMGYVIALDRENGDLAWTWAAEDGEVLSVRTESGVVLCQLQPDDGPPIFQALDVTRGVELWRFRQKDTTLSMRMPVLGDGYLCLLPRIQWRGVEVRDVFTGRVVSRFKLSDSPDGNAHHQVWIQNGMLIEPRFYAQNPVELNRVSAYDLQTGQTRWTESFDEEGRRELASVAVVGSEHYFVLRSNRSTTAGSRPGRVLKLLPEIGALQQVGTLNLEAADTPMLAIASQNPLDSPYMFLRSVSDNGQRVRLRAIHLPQGEQWSHTIPVAENDLFSRMPQPAVSRTTVAMLYNEWPSTQASAGQTRLRFIDRASGLVRDMRDLPADDFRYAYETDLVPLGDTLLLCGSSRMDVLGSAQDSDSSAGTVK